MAQRKASISRLSSLTPTSRLGREEKGKGPLVISTSIQPPRRRNSAVRVTFGGDSTDSDQHSPKSHPSTSTSPSARLLRFTSKAGLRSLDTSSNSSLRSISKTSPNPHGSPVQQKIPFILKIPGPLKLDEKATTSYPDQPLSSREPATPSYEEQFRRRRGDLLHRLGQSVPYMQAYGPTSLQCDALTTRLLGYLCEPGTPCFYKFQNRSAVMTALDLGCGPQLLWVTTAARFWPNAKVIGVDCIRPNQEVQIPSNVEFLQKNFLRELPTIETESVDFVRMSCLGTSIPESEWPIVLTEVRRILKPGGVVEIIDDEMYPAYLPKVQRGRTSRTSSGDKYSDQEADLHPVDRYFREMLVDRYGISKSPHKTIDTVMGIAFGENQKKSFRIELPSSNLTIVETEETRWGGNLFQAFLGKKDVTQSVPYDTPAKAQRLLGLDNGPSGDRVIKPFLIFHPYELCPLDASQVRMATLDASEVRMAACGNMHKVLSCRASLIDSIAGSGAEGDKLDNVKNMLWEYERFYQEMLNLPDDDWNEFGGEHTESGKEQPAVQRTSTDSYDSGYASQSSDTIKAGKGKASASITSDCTLVRRFRVFHGTKGV